MITLDIMGVPSSGKSTLAGALLPGLRQHAGQVYGKEEAVKLALRRKDHGWIKNMSKGLPGFLRDSFIGTQYSLDEWCSFATSYTSLLNLLFELLCRSEIDQAKKDCLVYAFIRQGVEEILFERYLRNQECVIWDEGFLHRGYTLFGYLESKRVSAEEIKRYVAAIPPPHGVVWVRAPLEVVLARLEQRVTDRIGLPVLLEPCPPECRAEQVAHGMACIEQLVEEADRSGVRVFEVNGVDLMHGPEEVLRVTDEIDAWLSSLNNPGER